MTKRKGIFLIALIVGCIVLFGVSVASAQPIDNRQPLEEKSTFGPIKTPGPPPKPPKKKKTFDSSALLKKVPPKRLKAPTVKTSDLAIMTEPKAIVTMTLQGRKAVPIKKTAANNGTAEFDDLQPGRYKISAALTEFVEQESEVTIGARDSVSLNFPLEPIKYQLNIETNIPDGEVRYAPARLVGKKPDNSLDLVEEGNSCIVKIKNKKATITGLRKKYYKIDIRPSPTALEYEPVLAAIEPKNIVDEEDEAAEDLQSYIINLETKLSDQTFGTAWVSDDWEMPAGWRLKNKMSTGGASGVALPRNPLYRYYIDFEMKSGIISLDGKTVGFALRAVDAYNYYLVEISLDKAIDRYRAKGYAVKNGVPISIGSRDIPYLALDIKAKKQFNVIIKGKGNTFMIFIEDNKGVPQPVGGITDSFKTFKKGAVGIAERNSSNFEVVFFTVCPSACLQ